MPKENDQMQCVLSFSGDIVDCVIAPLSVAKAEYWLKQEGKELFAHLNGFASIAEPEYQLGQLSDLEGSRTLEGCELRHGVLEVTNLAGDEVASFNLEDDEFVDRFIDDVIFIDQATFLIDNGPTIIARSTYSGDITYQPQATVESFAAAEWYAIVSDLGGQPFISELNFEGESVEPAGAGRYDLHEISLLVPQSDGSIRQLHYVTRPTEL